jgi:hypothetical protein
MSLLGGWVLAPLVLMALAGGCGLLAERLSGARLPGSLVAPVGMAVLIAIAGPFVLADATAELAAPAVVIAAVAGIALGEPWRDARLRALWPWPLLLALGAYAVYAAPSLLTGQGSITGYVKLDDSATWLALTDQILEHGRDRSGVPAGSYARTLEAWLGNDYPVGAFLPLGIAAKVAGVDPAAAYQPVIAVYAALLALGLHACARALLSPRAAAAAAFAAVQASLLFGYANWGGIKEPAAAMLLPTLAWLAVQRRLALLAVVAGASLGVLGINGLAWAGPALLIAAFAWWRAGERRWRDPLIAAGLMAVASAPALATLGFVRSTTNGAISAQDDLGNLAKPPPLLQGAGLWPAGDLRVDPHPRWLAVALALACLMGAYGAIAAAVERRAWPLVAAVGVAAAGTLPAVAIGSPWVDAKALAVLSPFVLLAAAAFVATRPRWLATAGAAVLALAVGWSTVLVTRDVFVAPRARLAELREMAPGVAAPAVVLDFEIYADRHFLRASGTDGATDLRERRVARADGSTFPELSVAEVDEIAPAELWAFRSIVRRRSPTASRPPAAFRRVRAGRYFELWERPADAPPPLARLPLSEGLDPAKTPECSQIEALAKTAGARELAAVARPAQVFADLRTAAAPEDWQPDVTPVSDGDALIAVEVPAAGRWRVYVGGSTLGKLAVEVDGRAAGALRHELAHDGQWLRFGALALRAGPHQVRLRYAAGFPQAGIGSPSPLGPLALVPEAADGELPVTRVPVADARELCGKRLDWVEALP